MPLLDFRVEEHYAADPRLGRRIDFRATAANYPLTALLTAEQLAILRSYTWNGAPHLNQLQEGSCCSFAAHFRLAARPRTRLIEVERIRLRYRQAQAIDAWSSTPPEEGTSIEAVMRILRDAALIKEWRWGGVSTTPVLQDLTAYVGTRGPAVLGIPWHNNLYRPDARGFLTLGGGLAGYHAIMDKGQWLTWTSSFSLPALPTRSVEHSFENMNKHQSFAKLHNSWGTGYGDGGDCYVRLDDLDVLLHEWGEVCIPTETS